jgi:hypothetical protein
MSKINTREELIEALHPTAKPSVLPFAVSVLPSVCHL